MSDLNGKPLLLRQTPMHATSSVPASAGLTNLRNLRRLERLGLLLLLVVLLVSVTACATPSTLPDNAARNPSMPAVSTPQPSKTYSDSVADSFKTWRERLTGTPATASVSSKPGPNKE
jgi:hypothetical protein